jgi:hypothetical protein
MPFRDSTIRATSNMDPNLTHPSDMFDLTSGNQARLSLSRTLVRESLDLEHTVIETPGYGVGQAKRQALPCWKAWTRVEISSLQSLLVPARSPRTHQALVAAVENNELLRQGQDYWTDEKIKEVEATVWSAEPSPSIVTSSCIGPMESEVEEEEVLSTLAHREGLRIAGITYPKVSFHCLGIRSRWTRQSVSYGSRRFS